MFALDLTKPYLRVLELKRKDRRALLQGLAEEKIEKIEALPELLVKLMKAAKPKPITSRHVAIALPEEETFIKTVQVEKNDKDSLKAELLERVSKDLPFSPEEIYWDWHLVGAGESSNHYDITFVAAEKKIVDNYIALIEQTGCHVAMIETEANALLWGAINPSTISSTTEPTLIVDLGLEKTTVVFFAYGAIRFSTSTETRLSHRATVAAEKTGDRKPLLTQKNLNYIVKQVNDYIEYYSENLAEKHGEGGVQNIKRIVVTGQWATFPELLSFIEKKLNIPVYEQAKMLPIKPTYVTALGLALRGLYEENNAYL